ncbi:hypothetical protein HDU76_007782, partial [Blyttiomyces sp. JEL0837]
MLANNAQPKSYWDLLPIEIKINILNKCDLLTQHLNNRLPVKAIKKHAIDIWKIAIKTNYDGDLTLLPKEVPDISNGLTEITSKDFYRRLCKLQPSLAGISIIQRFFNETYWVWTKTHHTVEYEMPELVEFYHKTTAVTMRSTKDV